MDLPTTIEDFRSFAETFTFAKLVILGNHISEEFCVKSLTISAINIMKYSRESNADIDWLSFLISMRDGLLAWNDKVEKKALNETDRDRKRRILNFLNDKFGNYIINKYLHATGIYEGKSEGGDCELFGLIAASDINQIKKLNYGIYCKTDSRIVLRQVPEDTPTEEIEEAWEIRLESLNAAANVRSNKNDSVSLLVTIPRKAVGFQHPLAAQTYTQAVSKQQPYLVPNISKSIVLIDGVPLYVNNYSSLTFIVEQLEYYCQYQSIDVNSQVDWIQLIMKMKDCGFDVFQDHDLRRKYRIMNIFLDYVGNFLVNKYLRLRDEAIDPDDKHNYLYQLIKNTTYENILFLNCALYLKDDNRYPLKPLPYGLENEFINAAMDTRVKILNSSSKDLLCRLPYMNNVKRGIIGSSSLFAGNTSASISLKRPNSSINNYGDSEDMGSSYKPIFSTSYNNNNNMTNKITQIKPLRPKREKSKESINDKKIINYLLKLVQTNTSNDSDSSSQSDD